MSLRPVLTLAPNRRSQLPPERSPLPEQIRHLPVRLSPIAWGTPDEALARGVCQRILDTTPPTVIPFDPRTNAVLRRQLRSLGIHH